MTLPRFGLNRFDARSVDAFAADVRRAEALGWDAAFQPDSQLRRRDTYVLMAAAARVTDRILLATLLSNPVMPDDPERGFMARVAREVLPPVRAALGTRSSKGA